MIEQALQPIKQQGVPVSKTAPDRKDNVSAYEKIKSKRAQSQSNEHGPKFTIDRQFSSSSKVLAKSLGRFNKVLNYLETTVPSTPKEEATLFAGLKINKKQNGSSSNNDRINQSQPPDQGKDKTTDVKLYGEQLELDLFPEEKNSNGVENKKPPVEVKKFDEPPKKSFEINQVPSIDIGHNPSDFKIHNIITDEIIKAISQSEPSLNVKDIGEHLASKLANEVRKQLASLPHAIATNEETTPVAIFDKEI